MTYRQALSQLQSRLQTFVDLTAASNVLSWDQATMAPNGGGRLRGRQLATLGRLSQDLLVDAETGRLIDLLLPEIHRGHLTAVDTACIREAKRQRDLMVRVPSALHSEMLDTQSQLYTVWTTARANNDFAAVLPLLEKSVEQSRHFADCFPQSDHPMDALIAIQDPGCNFRQISELFSKLRDELVPLVSEITALRPADDSCLRGSFEPAQQLAFCTRLAESMGYDFNRGRLDLSPHPFMIRFAGDDVRVTTRVNPKYIGSCLFGVMHEVGHALYELGVNSEFDGTIVGGGVSAGVHESQSRFWENRIGRCRPFWNYAYPLLREFFPEFETVPKDTFLRAINRVEAGLIRVEADELTYNLHVMIRFDCEARLLDGSLAAADLPDYWDERYKKDLGITVPSLKDGCMQDVHWYSYRIGGVFQGYTIGNLLSAQLYDAAEIEIPRLDQKISDGEFKELHGWLAAKIHKAGATLSPDELVLQATGKSLSIDSYMRYLTTKYRGLAAEPQ